MNTTGKILIVLALAAAVTGVVILKQRGSKGDQANSNENTQQEHTQRVDDLSKNDPTQTKENEMKALPRLVDLGAGTCIPCKMMVPILEELKTEYAGKWQIVVLDVGKNQDLINEYDVSIIPLQIFYDASGNELFRHEGFMAKEDILAKWKELGISFE